MSATKQENRAVLVMNDTARTFTQAGEKIPALKKTNITINAGELVAVIGPSGSGKSTFLTIAGGLQTPSSGTVQIGGIDITALNEKELSRMRLNHVGFILQASNLVPYLTVSQQLELTSRVAKKSFDKSTQKKIFTALGITKLRNKYPSDLSGGERQRAAIAKVLYGDPDLILADEPTASLDSKKAFDVVKLLAKETHERNKATIIVTHDERLIEYCDRVFEMHDGVLKERKIPRK